MKEFKFSKGDVVGHPQSGFIYHIEALPSEARIEKTNEPAYGYRRCGMGVPAEDKEFVWYRSQTEMEDGRFELIDGAVSSKDGLLWRDGEMLAVHLADRAATLRGFMYAERLVRHLDPSQS